MSLEEELQRLHDILNNPPFVDGPLQRIWRYVLELLGRLLGSVSPQGDGRWVVIVVGLVVATVVLFSLVRSVRSTLAHEARVPQAPADDAPATSEEALASAQSFAAASDYRNAMRQLYLATLIALDERGLLRYDRSLTNRETLRAVHRTNTALAIELDPVIDAFDRTWYGFAPVDARMFEVYRARVEVLRRFPAAPRIEQTHRP
jgi:hypothetical protein